MQRAAKNLDFSHQIADVLGRVRIVQRAQELVNLIELPEVLGLNLDIGGIHREWSRNRSAHVH